MTTVQTTTTATTTSSSTTPSAKSALTNNSASPSPHPLLNSDFAYLNWAISKLEVMTTSPLDDEARRLLKTIADTSLDDLIRADSVIKFTKTVQEDLGADYDTTKNVILAPTIPKAITTLVTTLNDESQEVRLESFVALTHLLIMKKKHEDTVFMKQLRDREKVARFDRGPLGVLDGGMVFELAMDILLADKDTTDAVVEHFYQAFKEFCSTGRKFILVTRSG